MNPNHLFVFIVLMMSPSLILADCPRLPGQEDERRANAGCVILHDDRVLLLTHRWGGKLGVPGGTREKGELAQCTAHRETLEETGLSVDVGERLAVMKNGFHLYRCYPRSALPVADTLPVPVSGKREVSALGWHALESLKREQWRFAYQFEQFIKVVGTEMEKKKDRN